MRSGYEVYNELTSHLSVQTCFYYACFLNYYCYGRSAKGSQLVVAFLH
jgi:hypothetical protein